MDINENYKPQGDEDSPSETADSAEIVINEATTSTAMEVENKSVVLKSPTQSEDDSKELLMDTSIDELEKTSEVNNQNIASQSLSDTSGDLLNGEMLEPDSVEPESESLAKSTEKIEDKINANTPPEFAKESTEDLLVEMEIDETPGEDEGETKSVATESTVINTEEKVIKNHDESSVDSQATIEYFIHDEAEKTDPSINKIAMPALTPIPELNTSEDSVTKLNESMPLLVPLPENYIPDEAEEKMEEDIDNFLSSVSNDGFAKNDKLLEEIPSPQSSTANTSLESNDALVTFVDSLLDKIRRKNSDSSGSEMPLKKITPAMSESEDDLLVEVEAPVRLSKPSNPNLMATPIVRNPRQTSVFVNSEEEYRRMVAKHKITKQVKHDDKGLMGSKSEPPRMKPPEMPMNIQRPRTLAERRQLFNQDHRNVQFLMVEQESKIFRQVQRKHQKMDINYNLLDKMLHEDVPTKHGPWRVLTWLRTREGNYIQQYIRIDDKSYKLNGSRGNHKEKFLPLQSCELLRKQQVTSLRSTRCCVGGRIKKRLFDSLICSASIKKFVLETCDKVDSYKRLETKLLNNQLASIKSRPLSKKIEFLNNNRKMLNGDEDSAFLGNYANFEMPDIQLEVTVEPKHPLDPIAKKYLKEILPHRDLNENWCEFALSALLTKEATDDKHRNNFQFTIPFQDNKRHILVRDIIREKEDNEKLKIVYNDDDNDEDKDDMEWTFAKDADLDDPVEKEVVEIIKDLTNSVFINLNDDLFTRDDPMDRREPSLMSPIKSKEAIAELSSLVKPTPVTSTITTPNNSKRILLELKRLNANVFKSESSCVEDEDDMRRHATAHLGKIERELRPTVIVTESDTVLLGNHEKESRRIKRAPKKFDDYTNSNLNSSALSDSERDEPPSKKPKLKTDYEHDEAYKTRNRSAIPEQSAEELKMIKDEIRKMIHVSVDVRRLEYLEQVETWCIIHGLYKCHCRGSGMMNEIFTMRPPAVLKPPLLPERRLVDAQRPSTSARPQSETAKQAMSELVRMNAFHPVKVSLPNKPASSALPLKEQESEELFDDGFSRRVLPISVNRLKSEVQPKTQPKAVLNSYDGVPKIEIVNLSDLINGGIGPIFMNVYDDNTMRLNPILRSLLNNKSAIIYFNGLAYFVDKKRVDVKKLDFTKIKAELETDHPIFIVQAKDSSPSPVSSTMSDEFVKFLFSEDSESFLQIVDKSALKEIAEIIESILRNVKKKLEMKMGNDTNDLVKEQLSMITRDRSRSRSTSASVSSANTSPLHFQGHQLTEAPPPGLYTPLMKEFNKIFSTRMQRLVALVASNSIGLRPSNEMLNKFYVYQWGLLLQSFEEDLVQIWQVKLESENGEFYQLMALTDSREVPEIEHAEKENIVNIRSLKLSDNITELTRMILLRIEKASMKNMTILFYGCKGYLRVCGILNSKENYMNAFVAKPSRDTHPRIAAKIQKIYRIWYASKKASEQRKLLVAEQQIESMEKHKVDRKLQCSPENLSTLNMLPKKTGQSDFKWFLFNITNDFSDIYIKSWCRYLSYRVIMQAIQRAKAGNRAVALTSTVKQAKRWPRIFALPQAPLKFKEHDSMTDNFLIFGPYMRHSNSNLLLMQNVDGELMLRDEYEKRNNINRTTRTRCLWIYANSLKCIHNADPRPLKLMWGKDGADFQATDQEEPEAETQPSNTKISKNMSDSREPQKQVQE